MGLSFGACELQTLRCSLRLLYPFKLTLRAAFLHQIFPKHAHTLASYTKRKHSSDWRMSVLTIWRASRRG